MKTARSCSRLVLRVLAVSVTGALLATACGSADTDRAEPDPAVSAPSDFDGTPDSSETIAASATTLGAPTDTMATEDPTGTSVESDDDADEATTGFVADPTLTRDDVDCSPDALSGDEPEYAFTTAHYVVDGHLGAVCFGDEDPLVVDAWDSLATITPPGQLGDLAIFAGFEPEGGEADETLAFVNTLDTDALVFQMSVNVPESEADPDELLLTMAHEFSHVFTATAAETDRTDEGIDQCDTYFNGEACYLDGSLMAAWAADFWSDELDGDVGPIEEDEDDADERCALDAGFFGPYAATSPEEDFAEAFSAYVFGLEPDSPEQQERLDWIATRPGLVEFKDRADAAGWTPLANNFDYCGR